jgi:hypothetical protein
MKQPSTTDPRENFLQNNIGFFFVGVLIITLLGFYPFYFSHFPMFEGFTWAYHCNAAFATLWIVMLIVQPTQSQTDIL